MSTTDTKDRIVRSLRNSDEPALSARDLAEDLDVSVRTVNNHVGTLIDKGRIATTDIGNATAYYIPREELPGSHKPDHTCHRCGRDADTRYDFAKWDVSTYFEDKNAEGSVADFYVLCRFCHTDLIHWIYNDPGSIGHYPGVHSWSLPTDQLVEVREDPEIETTPSTDIILDGNDLMEAVYEYIVEHATEGEGVTEHEIENQFESEIPLGRSVDSILRQLHTSGLVFQALDFTELTYRPAK